jgi:signal transduction histidine kinase
LYDIKELSVYEERLNEGESCRPEAVIREAAALYRDQGVRTIINAAPGHSLSLSREKLGCVVKNLLDNAVDFSPAHDSVTVDYRETAAGAILTVSDRGPGIPDAEKHRIFERFYTSRLGAAASGLHSGLGLAITARILETAGASIACCDNAPTGCRFVVTFRKPH